MVGLLALPVVDLQSFRGYLGPALDFMGLADCVASLASVFHKFLLVLTGFLFWRGGLCAGLSFYVV